jgi:hypothetical protein
MKTSRIPGTPKKLYFRVHRLVYALEHNDIPKSMSEITENMLTPPDLDKNGVKVEVSHLCHEPLCLNSNHLVLESHRINLHRIICRKQMKCTRDHTPHCIISMVSKF